MKKLLFIGLAIAIIGCSDTTSNKENLELDAFISDFDDKSIDEIREEVNSNISQLESFTAFFDESFENKIVRIDLMMLCLAKFLKIMKLN